ncbi:hypothetical protein BJY16_001808 [Actinoplanes octamycinicus]|uniref:DUF4314 domain-containing protein n=1 Tax=Actinoplanes octamycinicus TaxID=135948 RepID=A0A7W7M616_9ACTN|nr:DUF4314 domain-containing protein [Actinoplanes octamycinicus]MBB4738349.1 hypothetical protein [Actinoplanes octamycinicus]GIE57466.1 hypothetical protein Aoc01nite_28680 [Actinoplanes octamycinicus]
MTAYLPGQRVVLIHTSDPYTRLRPGTHGTVRRHDQHTNTVAISWDDGSTLAMLLDAGDRIAGADMPSAAEDDGDHRHGEPGRTRPDSASSRQDGQVAYVAELPQCTLHQLRNVAVPARYDAALRHGRGWAYLCEDCFTTHAIGLGTGRGQRLIAGERPGDAAPAAG